MAALVQFLNFLYPPRCVACGVRFDLDSDTRVCRSCRAAIEPLPHPLCEVCGGPVESAVRGEGRCARCMTRPPRFRRARSIARYRPSAEDDPASLPALLRRHKYGLDQSIGRALAEFLGPDLPISRDDLDIVVPVPLHWRRLWWRGFNQAALLAAEVARRLDLPLDTGVLARARATNPQTYRHHDERMRNVRSAFRATRPARIKQKCVLLVDDVMTTGATAEECARTLLDAGAKAVDVFTLARVI
jgi:ComF family protein